jgi:hypothetical protein
MKTLKNLLNNNNPYSTTCSLNTSPWISTYGIVTNSPSNTTTITIGNNTNYIHQVPAMIQIPGTDIFIRDDWQNNMIVWFMTKYGAADVLEFIDQYSTYGLFLDPSLKDYLDRQRKILRREKKINSILGEVE